LVYLGIYSRKPKPGHTKLEMVKSPIATFDRTVNTLPIGHLVSSRHGHIGPAPRRERQKTETETAQQPK